VKREKKILLVVARAARERKAGERKRIIAQIARKESASARVVIIKEIAILLYIEQAERSVFGRKFGVWRFVF